MGLRFVSPSYYIFLNYDVLIIMNKDMYSYIPERSNVCPICHGPPLKTCSICNTSFLCEDGECQKPIIQNKYMDKKMLYKFLKAMGSAKTTNPCPEHIKGGTENQSTDSYQSEMKSIGSYEDIDSEMNSTGSYQDIDSDMY